MSNNKISVDTKKLKKASNLIEDSYSIINSAKMSISNSCGKVGRVGHYAGGGIADGIKESMVKMLGCEAENLVQLSAVIKANTKTLEKFNHTTNNIKSNLKKSIKELDKSRTQKYYTKLSKRVGKKKAKELMFQLAKKEGVNVKLSDGKVQSVLKIKASPKRNGFSNSVATGSALTSTGAAVVSTKTKKKNSKSTSKNSKTKKGKKLKVVSAAGMASAATMTSYDKYMQTKFGTSDKVIVGTTNKIEQTKHNLNTKISQINSDKDAEITNIETGRNNNIADYYEHASNEIKGIDITDSDAKERIAGIKQDLESRISEVNKSANMQIEEVKANAEQKILEANQVGFAEIENIQKGSDYKINNIIQNGTVAETPSVQNLEILAKEVNQNKINEANSNK